MSISGQKRDVVVVGGGIIGLAVAMRLTREFPRLKVAVLEKEHDLALHQTGHNSGVIHAGIYYAPGSQKANFCATGAKLLREFCDERGIGYEMCGKVIVATEDSQVPALDELLRRGTANGAEGLEMIDRERLADIEPHAAGVKAIFSPNTGIIDYTTVARAYAAEAMENGADVFTGARVNSIVRREGLLYVETSRGEVSTPHLINSAGMHADRDAEMTGVEPAARIIPFRGEYFSIRPERAHLVNGLIYPVPDSRLPFLGVHFTKRIGGSVEAGPNAVLALSREGYRRTSFDLADMLDTLSFPGFYRMTRTYWRNGLREQYRSLVKAAFVRSLQALVPEVRSGDLYEPGAGVRAQAVGRDGKLVQDFSIAETRGAIHVLNAPSPGATSSLAIGQYIVDRARISFELAA